MAQDVPTPNPPDQTPGVPKREPGLFDTIGTFPVWLLKIIDLITPGSLVQKTPEKKKKVRI